MTPLPSPTVKKFNVTEISDYTSNSFHTYKIGTNGTKEVKPLRPKGSSPFRCVPFTCSVPIKNSKKLFHGLFHGKKACNKVLQDMTNVASFLSSTSTVPFSCKNKMEQLLPHF
jgi:hypothetical protein